MQTNEPDTGSGFEAITTLEELGRYLQGLREKRHVTQHSLSTKTGAITHRKLARSRISEIENAKRDRLTERELRTYMQGLKCTPRHIDQVVKVLTQCTATPAREFPADADATSPATLEDKPDDDPATAGHENEEFDRWPQVNICITPLAASLPHLSRRHWPCHRIALAAATVLVVVALAGLGVEFSLRRQSSDRPTSPGGPTTVLVPHSAPLIAEDISDLVKDTTFLGDAPVQPNQRFTKTREIRDQLVGRGKAAGRDGTQRQIEVTPVTPCVVELAGQRRPGAAVQCRGGTVAGPGFPDVGDRPSVAIDGSHPGADSGAMRDELLRTFGPDCCSDEWQPQGG